ncbi:hypothetical protein LTR47_004679 [Exophiala xenobiotica]|nr:hypothetical protein LTR41_005367 [Exophiala xenobiotica]KAK5234088.1 hypothetical protein LTR47_004679 [Exophiala xenobiotica]KAK5253159.1 hypothetical protein LTS06_002365 [Exophiala xenobiotica]KAK5261734.1 hypothetical protein LTR40_001685 [Exophiala xenobiotica]KAK5325053.1 hypothetical protein LTR93_004530 [Exophiala xenobiotica]
MRSLLICGLVAGATAQVSISYSVTATVTATEIVTVTTCPCLSSTTSSILIPDGTITPSSTIATTSTTTIPAPSSSLTTTSAVASASSASSITSGTPIPTYDAYINAILVHHNYHRLNHTALPLTWSVSLAATAQQIAETCVYGHVTDLNGGGYGQNIGAGYPGTPLGMGSFVTEGLYNGEVNNYIYYGMEPDLNTLNEWGHFTQIVWKSTTAVGCYTADCSATGLQNVGGNVQPYFTVCNYAPPGNFVGQFTPNVGVPIGLPSIDANYGLT